jgi:DNA processing protein
MLGIGEQGPTGPRPDPTRGRPPGIGVAPESVPERRTAAPDEQLHTNRDAERGAVWNAEREAERDAWVVLASVEGLGPVGFGRLLGRYGDGRAILADAARPGAARRLVDPDPRGSVDDEVATRIVEAAADATRIVDRVRELGLVVVTLEDDEFPHRLLEIEFPPHLLFVRGEVAALSRRQAIAIVGTRRATEYGRRIAARIAAAVCDTGATVVSGLAIGIDGAAHAAAVAAGVPTVAVLGGGHARLFPMAHERLADAIVAGGGAIVAELFPDVSATAGTFPRRNRLVSGLADATVVVEAPLKSGALITASWALEQGRECHLVPGPLGAPMSAGCLGFLREHTVAHLVSGVPELIEDLGLLAQDERGPQTVAQVELGVVERDIVRALEAGATTADELVHAARQPVATVLGAITLLEMRGFVTAAYGRYRLAGRAVNLATARSTARATPGSTATSTAGATTRSGSRR